MRRALPQTCFILLAAGVLALPVAYSQDKDQKPSREPDVIYVPTPQEVVDKMLELADVRPGEIVYDLGCGDGRIPVTAAKKYGVTCLGLRHQPGARQGIAGERREEPTSRTSSRSSSRTSSSWTCRKADVITLYLLPQLNVKLIPQLDKLKPGCRIVSHDFNMEGVRPKRELTYTPPGGREHRIYLWVTPLEKEKTR